MRIRIENQPDVELRAGDFCVIPRGILHNPIAEHECSDRPHRNSHRSAHTGDTQTPRTRSIEDQLKQA